ncbi:hypothetical protein SAMN05444487_11922 [Marininema mesophilum]|uniref:Lipoprotein n=1 Tax=Marininema mesophilum TaxID=1048340 RepID=A0A1H3C1C3_9BACL|nr:hypothetical protein [Marininema mesophilum]SDX47855.1 hypothetical protein SAMN05444487_11922 [Marininema mesophilum]
MKVWKGAWIVVLTCFMFLTACTPQPGLEEDLNAAVKKVQDSDGGATGNGLLRMSYVASNFEWDKLYIFSSKMTKEVVNNSLGFQWEGAKDDVVGGINDRQCLFVFVKDDKVVRTVKHDRGKGDFVPITKPLTPNTAVFLADKTEKGHWIFKPASWGNSRN